MVKYIQFKISLIVSSEGAYVGGAALKLSCQEENLNKTTNHELILECVYKPSVTQEMNEMAGQLQLHQSSRTPKCRRIKIKPDNSAAQCRECLPISRSLCSSMTLGRARDEPCCMSSALPPLLKQGYPPSGAPPAFATSRTRKPCRHRPASGSLSSASV